jgi:hypothetical protein
MQSCKPVYMLHKHLIKLLSCAGCDGAPLLPLLFVLVNMGFNISLLHLLKISSAVVSCLASTFSGSHIFSLHYVISMYK